MKSALIPAGLCLIMLLGFSWIMDSALADNDVTSTGSTTNDQVNSTGSNTAITGGYNSESTTTYSSGSSSNATTTNTTNAYTGDSRVVPSASAPAISSMSQDLCTVGISAGGQSFSFGASLGMTKRDLNCERLKLAKALHDMGMKVASIALMCQDSRVFSAMAMSGTSCPYLGSIGAEAQSKWEKYGKLRPDYEEYVKTLRITQQIDNKILEDIDEKFILDSNGNPTNINN
jgi:hypothetical protein|tara:strand:+ start:90 stop:782 length:693 start_codon:yes stop_codon:yes gene_type:complete